jgi:hypothetical protein
MRTIVSSQNVDFLRAELGNPSVEIAADSAKLPYLRQLKTDNIAQF